MQLKLRVKMGLLQHITTVYLDEGELPHEAKDWHPGAIMAILPSLKVLGIRVRRRWDEDLHSSRASAHIYHAGRESVVKKLMSHLETDNGFGNEVEAILNHLQELDTTLCLRVSVEIHEMELCPGTTRATIVLDWPSKQVLDYTLEYGQ